jgi:hypothetical protein
MTAVHKRRSDAARQCLMMLEKDVEEDWKSSGFPEQQKAQ